MNTREHALRVAVLEALLAEVTTAYNTARAEAQHEFAEARADGTPQQEVLLPDGTRIGLISIYKSGPSIDLDGEALLAWVRTHAPGMVERYVLPGAADSAAVVDLVAAHHPSLVGERIRPGDMTTLRKQIAETGGSVVDPDTGEPSTVATVTPRPPSGRFSYKPAPDAHARIMAEWCHGALAGVDLGPLPLPADATRREVRDG